MRVFVTALLLIAWLTITMAGDKKAPQQVVLMAVERQEIEGQTVDVVLVPKEARVILGLIPVDHQAPMPPQALMICYASSVPVGVRRFEGTDAGTFDDILFTCGGKRYLFTKLQIVAN